VTEFDLVSQAKLGAREALNNLENPEDDILPVVLSYGPRGLSVMGAFMPSTDEGKDELADNMTARIAVAQAQEAAMVSTAYLSVINTKTGKLSERQETIVLIHCTLEKQQAWTAKVTRHSSRPPDMSIWEELGEAVMVGGRFASAMVDGLRLASTVDDDMQSLLDEGYSRNRVDDLVRVFLQVMKKMRAEQT